MAKGLKLIGPRYSIIVLIFFIPYVLFQPPATVVLRKVGPRIFLTAIVILWGGCMIESFPFSRSELLLIRNRDLVSSRNGTRWLGFVSFSVSSKQDSSPDVPIFYRAGILATISKREMLFSTSLVAWHLHVQVSWPTELCR